MVIIQLLKILFQEQEKKSAHWDIIVNMVYEWNVHLVRMVELLD